VTSAEHVRQQHSGVPPSFLLSSETHGIRTRAVRQDFKPTVCL